MKREEKVNALIQLLSGKIKPEDLRPKRLCMAIGYLDEPVYTINEVEVSVEEYWRWAKRDFTASASIEVTYGTIPGSGKEAVDEI